MSFEIIEQLSNSIIDLSYRYQELLSKKGLLESEVKKFHLSKKKKKQKELDVLNKETENIRKSILNFTSNLQENIRQEETLLKNE